MDRTLEVVGDSVMTKSLDDRVGVFVMIEALRKVKDAKAEIHAVATTQEEVGLRGARVAGYSADPDISIAIDITLALDFPGMKPQEYVTQLGKGAALKYFDTSVIPNYKLVDHFRDLAEANGIPYQYEFLPRGGTDAGATAQARGGNAAFTLSIPTRYAHTVNEMARIADIQACIDLLAAFLNRCRLAQLRHRRLIRRPPRAKPSGPAGRFNDNGRPVLPEWRSDSGSHGRELRSATSDDLYATAFTIRPSKGVSTCRLTSKLQCPPPLAPSSTG